MITASINFIFAFVVIIFILCEFFDYHPIELEENNSI